MDGSDRTNSRGWKDVEHDIEGEPGVLRILIVGDSNTFGVAPLREIYPRVLENRLRAEGFSVEVISMGCPGWATDQEFEAYLQEGADYDPDIVISQFCGNDLSGNMGVDSINDTSIKPFQYQLTNGELEVVRTTPVRAEVGMARSVHRFSLRHSRLYFLANRTLLHNQAGAQKPEGSRLWFLQDKLYAGGLWSIDEEEDEVTRAQWALYEGIMGRWLEKCEEKGSVLLTFCESYDPASLEFFLHWGVLKEQDGRILARRVEGGWAEIDYSKPRERHRKTCEGLGIGVIPQNRRYQRFEWDPHPNTEGNRAIAQDIEESLLSNPRTRALLERSRLQQTLSRL